MSGIFHEGHFYENTDMLCRRCGHPVYESDNPEYSYQCFHCDEDLYSFEAEEQDGLYLPPVMVARPVDGITINERLEYLLDDTEKPRVFPNQPEAEGYLLAHGFDGEALEHFYFVEAAEMENKGCAFELKGGGKSRYFVSPEVSGFTDFARFLYENRASAAGTPLPIRKRIPQAEEISETAWQKIADHKAADCACYFILDISENQVWVNEDTGAGLALYLFPFTAVMEEAAFGTDDLWERLLARFPGAKLG